MKATNQPTNFLIYKSNQNPFPTFVLVKWLKITQRILAVAGIFGIWMGLYFIVLTTERRNILQTTQAPKSTVGIIHINTPELTRSLLFEFTFSNRDPRILKAISEYWQNLAQDSSLQRLPINFNQGFELFKIEYQNDFFWLVSGDYLPINNPYKPYLGFKKGQKYYWILNANRINYGEIIKSLRDSAWFSVPVLHDNPLQFQLISNQRIVNCFGFDQYKNQLTLTYSNTGSILVLQPEIKKKSFHISTLLNRGSILPQKYQRYKRLFESLKGFSINYYGAKYIDDNSGPSYLEPQFDLLMSFEKKTKPESIIPFLKELLGENIRYDNTILFLNNSRFYFVAKNDSTIYIGKNKMAIMSKNTSFELYGHPEVLTEITNLGWKEGVLELIPEFKALKDFTQSIKTISTNSNGPYQTVTIDFNDGINAQLESFLLILTLTNAYQF